MLLVQDVPVACLFDVLHNVLRVVCTYLSASVNGTLFSHVFQTPQGILGAQLALIDALDQLYHLSVLPAAKYCLFADILPCLADVVCAVDYCNGLSHCQS